MEQVKKPQYKFPLSDYKVPVQDNSDLANTLGNLVKRTISMSNQYFGGIVEQTEVKEEIDEELILIAEQVAQKTVAKIEQLKTPSASFEELSV